MLKSLGKNVTKMPFFIPKLTQIAKKADENKTGMPEKVSF